MKVEELVRASLREQADDGVRPPAGFADRVLTVRRRRRTRAIAGLAVATAAVVAAAVGVPALDGGGEDVRPASERQPGDVVAHPDQSPPRDLIAAGNTALAAFYTTRTTDQPDGDKLMTRTYGLLDQKTGKYEKAPKKWAWIDVAPGMRTAAVLEGELPARRIGLLNLITGKVERWIPVNHQVAGVSWSPDGSKLVATAYSKNPDRLIDLPDDLPDNDPQPHGSRTGFFVVDASSGDVGAFRELPQKTAGDFGFFDGNPREDLRWSRDGKLLYVQLATGADGENRAWYTLKGDKTKAPAAERYAGWPEAGLSPDGKLLASNGDAKGSPVLDPRTGKEITTVPGQQLLAWADNKRIIAWGCDPEKCGGKGEFRNQLLLVTVGSKKVVPLSDFRKASDAYPGRWSPMFAAR
ncbi:WD40 repeat domain-containing protein [Streptomyces sp. BA2]|uniref:WD40 repeat domain-containing protein n=1 Tax=Streptomyces sp. BA2 TaxID=436595 RepID=UPI001323456A|nr:WD40 repeat domain-containing protein [Streptomyces sp. BA2]